MKFTSTAIALGAIAASTTTTAQTVATPYGLLSSVEAFLSPGCISSLSTLVSGPLASCLQLPYILPILNNTNTSIVPQLDTYFKHVCSSPACSPDVIQNATTTVLTGCAAELKLFGVSNSTVRTITGAYPTAREVVCLSTTSSNSSTIQPLNSTSSSNATLCPTSLLTKLETYLGAPLTNAYIDTAILGGNATAYTAIKALATNTTLLKGAVCNDCVAASVDVVLENYPQLQTLNFSLPTTNSSSASNMTLTVPTLYKGLCNVTVGSNVTLPKSINETAFNTTLPYAANSTASPLTNSTTAVKKRYMRWD